MSRFLPRFVSSAMWSCDDSDYGYTGRQFSIIWLGFMIEIALLKRERP